MHGPGESANGIHRILLPLTLGERREDKPCRAALHAWKKLHGAPRVVAATGYARIDYMLIDYTKSK